VTASTSRPRIILALIVFMGLVLGLAFALKGAPMELEVRLGAAVLLAAPAIWLTRLYWLSIDEAAREAQKSAWLWGGSLGMALGLLVIIIASQGMFGLGVLVPVDASPLKLLMRGALLTVAGQLAGFLVAWAYWWWRRR
jgi:hypothetical protein